tara:strand:- start:2608 stop:2835 length:228 start_codon:yes stop_codon:yes gene_type:complete
MPKYKKKSKTNTEKKNPLNRRKKISANVVNNFHKLYGRNKKLHKKMLENELSQKTTFINTTEKISIKLPEKEQPY